MCDVDDRNRTFITQGRRQLDAGEGVPAGAAPRHAGTT